MTEHVRQKILTALATRLTGLTTTGANVFRSRVYPLDTGQVPGLLIYAESETVEPGSGRKSERQLTIKIEGYAVGPAIDDILDQIALEVEIAIAAEPTLSGLCKDLLLLTTQIEKSGEPNQPMGLITLNFLAWYQAANGAPDQAL